jgi:hypothetical protein
MAENGTNRPPEPMRTKERPDYGLDAPGGLFASWRSVALRL